MGVAYLIRHGEVEWNREDAYVGSTDLPLNSNGRRQAARLADYLERRGISAICSSDLTRARETAQIIAHRLGLAVQVVHELREVDYGEWEGIPDSEVRRRYAGIFDEWRASPLTVRIPGGETFAELRDRVLPAFRGIADAHQDEAYAVVAHKCVNRVILCCLLGLDVNIYRRIGQCNSAVNMVRRRADGTFVVEAVNERCHLWER